MNLEPEKPFHSPGWGQIGATGELTEEIEWSLRRELFDALVELELLVDRENQVLQEANCLSL